MLELVPPLAVVIGLAFAINWVAFVPAYLARTERFYDLAGGFTYLTVVGVALLLAPDRGPREWVLATLVALWAARLSSFLFGRIKRDGKDGRFDEIKQSAPRFLIAWTLQALWVSLTALAMLIVLTQPSSHALTLTDFIGWGVWLTGFVIEVVADRQKSAFRARPDTHGTWIDEGLWAWSRHPNYFGEIVLWTGICISAATTFAGWQWIGLVSPLFVAYLLLKGSGVPLLEVRADKKWGGDAAYEAYKQRVPVLIPRPPRRGD
ncbi:MAG: DUF1295 domain-containing protein [Deltaproteobacteria bacterium]|nr:DUF1295 domain-containing protein [Deltaproteobacteria bacterium]